MFIFKWFAQWSVSWIYWLQATRELPESFVVYITEGRMESTSIASKTLDKAKDFGVSFVADNNWYMYIPLPQLSNIVITIRDAKCQEF
jgi:hypothetical protein